MRITLTIPLLCILLLQTLLAAPLSAADTEGKRYVIIHADDAGMSHSVNMATINGMEQGIVSSASIMVPCPWFKEFAEYARQNPDKDYGIHLTLNSEWDVYRWGPVAPREKVPSLVDEEGYLWDGVQQVVDNAKREEVELELRAQIDRAKQFGVPLSHLDTHMGALLSRPDLVEVYVDLGIEYNLPVLFLRKVDLAILAAYPALARKAGALTKKLQAHNMPMLESITQYYVKGAYDDRKDYYLNVLRNLRPGVSEIIIHCGYNNQELQGITSSAPLRDSDWRVFTDPEVIGTVKELGVEVVTWKQFREMNDAARKAGETR